MGGIGEHGGLFFFKTYFQDGRQGSHLEILQKRHLLLINICRIGPKLYGRYRGAWRFSFFFKYDRIPKMAVKAAILKIFKRDLLPNHMSD